MENIKKIKSISVWIFLIPFIAVNACLLLTTQFHSLIPDSQLHYRLYGGFPYFDGSASISRTARYFPANLIFKPAMFLTSFFLIKYWLYNKKIIQNFDKNHKHLKKIVFFGVGSAIALTIHSIFLGVHFENDLYKFFRRVIMLTFIIFEIVAQAYLVTTLYSFKNEISKYINERYLTLKIYLVSTLVLIALISIPIISIPGNDFFGINLKYFKHALEWDYFIGVISFYLLTFKMWKNKKN